MVEPVFEMTLGAAVNGPGCSRNIHPSCLLKKSLTACKLVFSIESVERRHAEEKRWFGERARTALQLPPAIYVGESSPLICSTIQPTSSAGLPLNQTVGFDFLRSRALLPLPPTTGVFPSSLNSSSILNAYENCGGLGARLRVNIAKSVWPCWRESDPPW